MNRGQDERRHVERCVARRAHRDEFIFADAVVNMDILGVLRNEEVVSTRRQGKNIYYSVADPALLEILAVLYRLYCSQEK